MTKFSVLKRFQEKPVLKIRIKNSSAFRWISLLIKSNENGFWKVDLKFFSFLNFQQIVWKIEKYCVSLTIKSIYLRGSSWTNTYFNSNIFSMFYGSKTVSWYLKYRAQRLRVRIPLPQKVMIEKTKINAGIWKKIIRPVWPDG